MDLNAEPEWQNIFPEIPGRWPQPPFTVSIIGGEEKDLSALDDIISAYKVYYNYKDWIKGFQRSIISWIYKKKAPTNRGSNYDNMID